MISVQVTLGKRLSLRMKGHAGSAEIGKDLVCASASILAYTLAQNVRDHQNACEKTTIKLDEGDAEISCIPNEECIKGMRILYAAFVRGFELLQANFPDKVSVQRGNTKHRL